MSACSLRLSASASAAQILIGERWALRASAPKITERKRKLALIFALKMEYNLLPIFGKKSSSKSQESYLIFGIHGTIAQKILSTSLAKNCFQNLRMSAKLSASVSARS